MSWCAAGRCLNANQLHKQQFITERVMKSPQKSAPFAPALRRIAWNSANFVFNLAVPPALLLLFSCHCHTHTLVRLNKHNTQKQIYCSRRQNTQCIYLHTILYHLLCIMNTDFLVVAHTRTNLHIYIFIYCIYECNHWVVCASVTYVCSFLYERTFCAWNKSKYPHAESLWHLLRINNSLIILWYLLYEETLIP